MKKQLKKLILLCSLCMVFILSLNVHTSYAEHLGDFNNPFSVYNNPTFNCTNYTSYTTSTVQLQLLDYKEGNDAWNFIYNDSEYMDKPSSNQHWLLFKFYLKYVADSSNTTLFNASDVIYESTFCKQNKSSLYVYDYMFFNNYPVSYDVELALGTSDEFYFAILVDNSISYPMLHIDEYNEDYDYDTDTYIDNSIWVSTDPNYIEPTTIKQSQTVTASDITKTYGNSSFNINAKSTGDGILRYTSSDTSIATISSAGKVTIKKAGEVDIIISASETDTYKSASKTITLTINKAKQTITTSANTYKKVNKGSSFSLGTKRVGNGKLTYSTSNSKVVTVSSTGKVTIKGCGTATITIKSASTTNYNSASKKVTVTIIPAKMSAPTLSSPKKKALKISVTKQATVSGYQYQYATNSSFTKGVASKSTSTTKNITKLVSKKTYYVRVRAYKVINGKTYYGSWSTTKKLKIK